MDDIRAPEKVSVIQYQRKRKVDGFEPEYESVKKCGKQNLEQANSVERERFAQMHRDVEELKRKFMDMKETTNSFVRENESLRQELDSTREQLKSLQKCHEEADLKYRAYVEEADLKYKAYVEEADVKYKADVKLLMNKIKSLRSSQSELRQELYRIERNGASNVGDIIGLNSLPDDVLIVMLSHMSLMEAVRTSVLSRRWRHLWRFTSGSLDFDKTDAVRTSVVPLRSKRLSMFASGSFNFGVMETNARTDADKVIAWVDHVIKLHQGPRLDSFIVRFNRGGVYDDTIPRWIYFAMQKEVKRFELKLGLCDLLDCHYDFPKLKKLLSLKCAFGSLRSLKFESVNITDEVVHYLLASCSNLERLSITCSSSTRNLKIVDPIPNLKTLEISYCSSLESLKVSAASILSLSFEGLEYEDNKLLFGNIPNLSELTLKGDSATSFIYNYEDNKLASYSLQLVKLSLHLYTTKYTWAVPHYLPRLYSLKRLKLSIDCRVGKSLLFFTLLIKAAPVLNEFRIEVNYNYNPYQLDSLIPFPSISEDEAPTFHHENLKLVELVGYIGCSSEKKFLLRLFKVAPSFEKVVIDVKAEHFDEKSMFYPHKKLRQRIGARTMKKAKVHAKRLQSVFPPKTQLIVR